MAEVEYRAAHEGDIPELLALYREVYGRAPSAEFYRWKFFAPIPDFPTARLWLAKLEGRVVGCGGAMPHPFWVDSKEQWAAALIDYHIVKELRRQHILLELHGRFSRTLISAGVAYFLNMPSESGAGFCTSIQQQPFFKCPWVRRRVSWPSLLFSRPPAGRRVRKLDSPGLECAELWDRVRGDVNCCSIPAPQWLQYRYADCPGRPFEFFLAVDREGPRGLLVMGRKAFKKRNEGVIAYCLSAPQDGDTLSALVLAAARAARAAKLRGLRTLTTASPLQEALWKDLGFRAAEGEFVIHARNTCGEALPAALTSADVFFPRLGDHDFV